MSFIYIVLVPFMDFDVRFFVILYSAVRFIFMFVALFVISYRAVISSFFHGV